MNLDRAWGAAVSGTAGAGVVHAVFTYSEPSAWLVLIGGAAMICICVAGIYQDRTR